jgi:acetyltransferase-like isoleucine patch superfamily enzyme
MADRGVHLRQPPTARWRIGNEVYLARGVILDLDPGAELFLGDRVKVMHHSVLAGAIGIRIGRLSQIAELSSIRDANHGIDTPLAIQDAPSAGSAIAIGSDVWIGRGCAVLAGVTIGDGAVVGANSTVTGNLPDNAVAVGSPAKVVRYRQKDDQDQSVSTPKESE